MLKILYEDKEMIVVVKPPGMESQSSRGFAPDMVSEIRRHIYSLSTKKGEPYVGVIHRLDKPVEGLLVYAKTKKAAGILSKALQEGRIKKEYLAVICGKPVDIVGNFVDYLLKDVKKNESVIVDKGIKGAKRAELNYQVLGMITEHKDVSTLTLVKVELITGRHHQIRAQFAAHGFPLWGDCRYNPLFQTGERTGQKQEKERNGGESIALAAYQLSVPHPSTGQRMTFETKPKGRIFQQFKCLKSGE